MNDISKLISDSNDILIMTHENPDGDAIGSALAFFNFLTHENKNVDILLPEIPPVFMFLHSIDRSIKTSNKKYDLAIIVDCSSEERIGQTNSEFNNCDKSIVIDHHASNTKYGTINYIDGNVASCCQLIYYLFKSYNYAMDKNIAECLMVGSITDTNGFANNNVDKETFLMAADMFSYGVDITKIYFDILNKKNFAQFNLIKLVLKRLTFFCDGKIAFSYITKKDIVKCKAKLGDYEGLANIGRNIEGVFVSIFVREDDDFKISFRSNGMIDVSKIALKFNGGGHFMAAGGKSSLSFKETKDNVINETIKEILRK